MVDYSRKPKDMVDYSRKPKDMEEYSRRPISHTVNYVQVLVNIQKLYDSSNHH